jgi:hypothetical protein
MAIYRFELSSKYVWLEARSIEDVNDLISQKKGLFNSVNFQLWQVTPNSEDNIGRFTFAPMPGCCGIVVSAHTWLDVNSRHGWLSNSFRELKHKLAKELGYTVMIATSQTKDIPALNNMLKSKYNIAQVFRNKRTDNDVGIGIKLL